MAQRKKTVGGKAKQTSIDNKSFVGPDPAPTAKPTDTTLPSKQPDRGSPGKPLAPGLYVVATPIGNAADITLRALDVLAAAESIACEDTRVTAKLLAIHGIAAPLTPYHDHNARTAGPKLIEKLKNGGTIALVCDAGTPLISDPGYRLVRTCADEDIPVFPVPGASAVLAALSVAGLPTDRFLFSGFPPPRGGTRRRFLADLTQIPASLVLMEAPPRLVASLTDMADVLGPREAVIARELTKMFEEVCRGTLAELAEHYRQNGPPKGEVTIVVAPPMKPEPMNEAEIDRLLTEALGQASARGAAERVAAETGLSKRHLYGRAIALRKELQ